MTAQEDFILEVLDLLKSKFKNGDCTKGQADAVYHVMSENLPLWATADEIAEHFGKSRDAVHSVIKNKLIQKPRRNVTLYPFNAFRKVIPSSWLKRH